MVGKEEGRVEREEVRVLKSDGGNGVGCWLEKEGGCWLEGERRRVLEGVGRRLLVVGGSRVGDVEANLYNSCSKTKQLLGVGARKVKKTGGMCLVW